jgi:acetyl-CoA carboxylase carboxyltransferase component
MAGPAMIAGGGLGDFAPEEIGPVSDQAANGVLDVVVDDEAEAIDVVRRLLGYLDGPSGSGDPGDTGDQAALRTMLPENDRQAFDVRPVVEALADRDSLTWLRAGWAPELVTALAHLDGPPSASRPTSPPTLPGL